MKTEKEMDDLDRFIAEWKKRNPELAKGYDEGYENFKIGVLFKLSREQAGMTQEEVARKLGTKKIRHLPHRKPRRRHPPFNLAQIRKGAGQESES